MVTTPCFQCMYCFSHTVNSPTPKGWRPWGPCNNPTHRGTSMHAWEGVLENAGTDTDMRILMENLLSLHFRTFHSFFSIYHENNVYTQFIIKISLKHWCTLIFSSLRYLSTVKLFCMILWKQVFFITRVCIYGHHKVFLPRCFCGLQ